MAQHVGYTASLAGDNHHGAQIAINHGQVTNNFNLKDQEHQLLHALLSTGIKYDDQKDQNPEPVQNTCRWTLEHPRYQKWKTAPSSQPQFLWISADPGCGKSVLSRHIIDKDLQAFKEAGGLVLYYFFKDTSEDQRSVSRALSSMLHQIFCSIPDLIRLALPMFANEGTAMVHSFSTLQSLFTHVLAAPEMINLNKQVVCLVDALDECHESQRGKLVSLFKQLIQDQRKGVTTSLKILVTSRPYLDIAAAFGSLVSTGLTIKLDGNESQDIKDEIDLVIKYKVKEFASSGAISATAAKYLEEKLLTMKQRTYLWLRLLWELIPKTWPSDDEIEDLISELPDGVSQAYERLLRQCPNQNFARRVLQIVLAAERPLTIDEMDVALHMNEKTRSFSQLRLTGHSRQKETLPGKCGHVISIVDSRIYLIHQTVKDFLVGSDGNGIGWLHSIDLASSHHLLGNICLDFLFLQEINRKKCNLNNALLPENIRITESMFDIEYYVSKTSTLLLYAANFWADHWTKGKINDRSLEEIVDLQIQVKDRHGNKVGKAMHAAALGGHGRMITLLLAQGVDFHTPGGDMCSTPLQGAASNGHLEVVQRLLDHGADVNATGGDLLGTPLQGAASLGHQEMIQLLLAHGADINATRGQLLGTPLEEASMGGYQEIVQLLLTHGADVNISGEILATSLQVAASGGYQEIVQLLLAYGADVNAPGYVFGTALQHAVKGGNLEIVRFLLSRGANVNAPGGDKFGTALQEAAGAGYQDIVQLLLAHGASINATGSWTCSTALQRAREADHEEIVQLLLAQGVKSNDACF